MERRALLAVVLSFAVIAIWNRVFVPPLPQPTEGTPAALADGVTPGTAPGVMSAEPEAVAGDAVVAEVREGDEGEGQPDAAPQPVVYAVETAHIDNGLVSAELSSLGGGVSSWVLSRYTESADNGGLLTWLWTGIKAGFSFGPLTHDGDLPPVQRLNDGIDGSGVLFTTGSSLDVQPTREQLTRRVPNGAEFTAREGNLEVKKTVTLGEGYIADVAVTLTNQGASDWRGRPMLVVSESVPHEKKGALDVHKRIALTADGAEFEDISKIKEDKVDTVAGEVTWFGVGDHYFLSAAILDSPAVGEVRTQHFGDRVAVGFQPDEELQLGRGESKVLKYRIFLGPKDIERLEAIGAGLEKSIDFGFFSFFAYPLLALLKVFYSLVGSYGIAIILLTVSMKALTFPLTHKSLQSMQRMKEIQPEIKKLQDQYGENKEALNQEMMKLMSERKVNPLGGCLPTVVQLPVWFALYRVLQSSIELYHTSFLYLKDLSAADPYGITPIVLGVLMVLQQKLTPNASVDPNQQRIMQLMPVFFSFIMFNLPSGLVLYILVNSLLSIAHHFFFLNRGGKVAA